MGKPLALRVEDPDAFARNKQEYFERLRRENNSNPNRYDCKNHSLYDDTPCGSMKDYTTCIEKRCTNLMLNGRPVFEKVPSKNVLHMAQAASESDSSELEERLAQVFNI